jgi:hypothetical protein
LGNLGISAILVSALRVSGSGVNCLRLWVLFYCLCCYYLFVIVELFVIRQDCKVSEKRHWKGTCCALHFVPLYCSAHLRRISAFFKQCFLLLIVPPWDESRRLKKVRGWKAPYAGNALKVMPIVPSSATFYA